VKTFLAHSFRDEDRGLVAMIERLLASHDVPVTTGVSVGGGAITEQVMRRIESVETLIAVMTKGQSIGETAGKFRTHPWVENELSYARAHNKLTIALVDRDVELAGAYQDLERIDLDAADPLDALLRLSETVCVWKRERGWPRRVQLKPDTLGHMIRTSPELRCRYRFVTKGERSRWSYASPIPQANGTVVYLDGIKEEDQYIEIEVVRGEAMEWYSPATAQLISVELQQKREL
jgi:hypothetical protein